MSKSIKIILIAIIVIILAIILNIFVWYTGALKPVAGNRNLGENLIRVEIAGKTGTSSIAELLEEKHVIKSANAMKIYCKINNVNVLQAGKYDLDPAEDMVTIIEHIINGDVSSDEIKITFVEGKNIRWFANTIAEKTVNTQEDVYELLEDEEYIDSLIEKYWFLTDDIKNKDIYYPLEGYLLPDTYVFENDEVSVQKIFNVILNYTEKYLNNYKEEFEENDLSINEIMTLASITELEGKTLEDREEIIGVFLNRLEKGMSLGSDVTTYYAFKVDMGERDLTAKELNTSNPYNTRASSMVGKLPVGPICNPSKEAIQAVFNYKETDALYFVADKNGKVYFTKSNEEHNKMIKSLKSEGLWFTY